MANRGQFKKGADPRRHKFSREECSRGGSQPGCHRLTDAHRSMGGHAAFDKYMAEHRIDQGLPVPENLAPWVKRILEERQRKQVQKDGQEIPF